MAINSANNLGSWSSLDWSSNCRLTNQNVKPGTQPNYFFVDKFSGHLVKMGRKWKYHLNFSCLYHGTIPLFCYGRLGKNKYLHRHWLSKSSEQSRAGFVGCNGSKLKDLYEKSFVSLPLIAIVSPFLFFLISAGSSVAAWRCAAPKEAETKKMHLAKVHLRE